MNRTPSRYACLRSVRHQGRFVVGPIALVLLLTAMSLAAEGAVTLAWDPNPEPEVIGYRVYVGTQSGVYSETHDVSVYQSSLVYTTTAAGIRYYFAVAAIAKGPLVGPKSAEVSAIDGGVPQLVLPWESTSNAALASSAAARASSASGAEERTTCGDARTAACYAATVLATGLNAISSLTPAPDGRLLFIEDQQRVRILTASGLMAGAALETGRSLTSVSLDPTFTETGLVFVGQSEPLASGSSESSIVRYRELGGILGEPAVIVTGLEVPRDGLVPFALDANRRLYVAVPEAPRSAGRSNDPYASHILRFNPDGTLPTGSRGGSPVFAGGFTAPAAMVWLEASHQLWFAGSRDEGASTLAYLDAATLQADGWPHVPTAVPMKTASSLDAPLRITSLALTAGQTMGSVHNVFLIAAPGLLYRGVLGASGLTDVQTVSLNALGEPVSIAAGSDGLYVAIRTTTPQGAASFSILRLNAHAIQ